MCGAFNKKVILGAKSNFKVFGEYHLMKLGVKALVLKAFFFL